MKSFVNEKPYLTIPKFEIEYDIEWNAILKNVRMCRILFVLNFIWLFPLLQLSIAEIFGDNADFSELSECNAKLHINKIVQKAYFGIDELGTMGTKGGFRSGSEYLISVF